jgi:hypothetical protein
MLEAQNLSTEELGGVGIARQLRDAATSLAAKAPRSQIFIAVAHGRSRHYVAVGEGLPDAEEAELLLPLGCCTKLLVSAMVGLAAEKGLLDLHESPYRIVRSRLRDHLGPVSDISVLQFLNHTHGLQRSSLRTAPFSADGRMDAESIFGSLNHEARLASPGEIYSYGHEGSWICAAVLEDVLGASFGEWVGGRMFSPDEIGVIDGTAICPATGRGLSIKAHALLTFLLRHSPMAAAAQLAVPLPGWSPFISRCAVGWHRYEGDWAGHDSILPAFPLIVRVDPTRNLAVIVAGKGLLPSAVAARAFAKLLPDLVKLRVPRMKTGREPFDMVVDSYCGSYHNGDTQIEIAAGAQGLVWRLSQGSSAGNGGPPNYAPLLAAEEEVFLCTGGANKIIPFVQFRKSAHGANGFLWTGELTLSRR